MIISHKRAYVFVHIPKTGGTSLATALEDRTAADDILIGDTPKALRRRGRLARLAAPGRIWKHSTLQDVAGLYPADAFVFTLVRNPWDRMVSYYHWLRMQRFDHPAVATAKAMDFGAFLRDAQTQHALRQSSYTSYLRDEDGTDRCNLYARLEYPGDLDPLWQHLGFKLSIPHLNRSTRDLNWRTYYDAEGFEIVGKIATDDIARFGYQTTL